MQIHFLSDVLISVALLDLKVPNKERKQPLPGPTKLLCLFPNIAVIIPFYGLICKTSQDNFSEVAF